MEPSTVAIVVSIVNLIASLAVAIAAPVVVYILNNIKKESAVVAKVSSEAVKAVHDTMTSIVEDVSMIKVHTNSMSTALNAKTEEAALLAGEKKGAAREKADEAIRKEATAAAIGAQPAVAPAPAGDVVKIGDVVEIGEADKKKP